jgi:hypothetical protein
MNGITTVGEFGVIWIKLRHAVENCSQAVADHHLCLEIAPNLRSALLDRLQRCLCQWETLSDHVVSTAPSLQRQAFDRLGNILHMTAKACQHGAISSGSISLAEKLRSSLTEAQQLIQLIEPDMIWSKATVSLAFEQGKPRTYGHDGAWFSILHPFEDGPSSN